MAVERFKTTEFSDANLQKLQDNCERKFDVYDFLPFFGGILIKDVAITTSDTTINHGLKKVPVGYLVVKKNANAQIWDTANFNQNNITLRASATVTANVWVF